MDPTNPVFAAMLGGGLASGGVALLAVAVLLFSLLTAAAGDGGTATATATAPAQIANLDALIAEIKAHGESEKAGRKVIDERLRALEEATKGLRLISGAGVPGLSEDPRAKGFRMLGVVRAMARLRSGDGRDEAWKGFEYEREVTEAAQRAAMSSGDDASGAYLIAPETDPVPITSLRPATVMGQAGCRMVTAKGVPYRVPEVIAGASGGWIGDNTAPAESKASTALKEAMPLKYGMLVKVDRSALALSDPALEGYVREDMLLKVAEVLDLAWLTGTGAAGQPRGLLNYGEMAVGGSQVIAIGANGGSLTFALAAQMIGKLEDDNALRGKLGFVSHPKNRRRLKNERILQYANDTSGGVYIPGSPIMSDAQFESAIGYPWLVTTQLPVTDPKGNTADSSPVVFGNWQDHLCLKWGGGEIRPLFERGAELDQVWFVLFIQANCLRLRTKSFVTIRDARTNGI